MVKKSIKTFMFNIIWVSCMMGLFSFMSIFKFLSGEALVGYVWACGVMVGIPISFLLISVGREVDQSHDELHETHANIHALGVGLVKAQQINTQNKVKGKMSDSQQNEVCEIMQKEKLRYLNEGQRPS